MVLKLITFRVDEESYALPLDHVKSIERLQAIRPVPHAPKHIVGIMNLRGVVLTIADMRSILDMPKQAYTDDTRILVVDTIGFIVDEALDVLETDESCIEPRQDVSELIVGVLQKNGQLVVTLSKQALLKEYGA